MEGLVILDDLDSDDPGRVLRDDGPAMRPSAGSWPRRPTELKTAREAPEAVEAAAAKLDAVSGKMQSLERNILQ